MGDLLDKKVVAFEAMGAFAAVALTAPPPGRPQMSAPAFGRLLPPHNGKIGAK
jgi:hypothetical protein